MSSSMGGLDDATFAWDHRIHREVFLSGLAILVYDHIITLDEEVKIIWSSKRILSKWWFLTVRYISLGCSITMAVFYFADLSPESCSTMERVLEFLLLIQAAFVQLTLQLRVFAMYGFNRWVLVSMGITGTVAGALGLWTIIEFGHPKMLTAPGLVGCNTALPRSTAIRSAAAWEAQLACDLLIFGLTVYRAYTDSTVRTMVSGSLISRMFRDGSMYFGIMVLANLGDILTLYFGDIIIAGILSWGTTSLSVTLISRLGLNLHRANTGETRTEDFQMTDPIHFVTHGPPAVRTEDDLMSLEDV
ncbi:hypothetical protein C8R43DRAFT_1006110 [Mycena crocata]|nr:hypothetical protein C8R43DRAFT_1006110 [Mycena crocata]